MKTTKNRQKLKMPIISTTDGRKPKACVLLENESFGIPGGSYLMIDTDTPYIDGKLSVVLLDGELRLLRVNSVNEVFLFTAENFSEFMEREEITERVKFVGVAIQALIDLNAKFSSERFHAQETPN